jgi:hypothetical protein
MPAEPMQQRSFDDEPEPGGQLIPRDTIANIVARRDDAVRLYEEFFDQLEAAHVTLRQAQKSVALACGDGAFSAPYVEGHAREIEEFQKAVEPPNVEAHKRVARRLTDLQVWGAVIAHTELEVLMDRTAKDKLRKQMAYVPEEVDRNTGRLIDNAEAARGLPPVTVDNILATLETFRENAGEIWKRGIATAFSKLDRRFRSHDGFKIGTRLILTYAFNDWGSWNHYDGVRDTILDIERVFLILDGKKPTAAYGGIVGAIEAGRRNGFDRRQSRHFGDYFEIRVFKNGNAHLWFRRNDLLAKVNRLLADYYGAGLGWGKAEREPDPEKPFSGAIERAPARNFGLFPTPDSLADWVIREAHLYSDDPLQVLEPSAGTGQLARRVAGYEVAANGRRDRRETKPAGHRVTAVEIQPELAADLRRAGYCARVLARDFLAMPAEPIYDRVVMNPPFDRGRDIDHAHHALRFVKPGGRLVAIMSASAEYASTPKAEAFRAQVEKLGGRFQDLPEGSFRECGTNVNVVLLTVDKKAT